MARILAPLFMITLPVAAAQGGLPAPQSGLLLALAALFAVPFGRAALAPVTVRGRR